ncbi:MAG TPA: FKBP-type peptidyl-prolyl cis-trans isomerase [Saprospiraceae bacterium]|nr:FKBP-type peptidyl-prolyl cis-trans isomerase [Saprospiraceae bacterium]
MKFRILLFLLAAVAMTSCQQEAVEKDTLPSGYEYILHTPNNTSPKAEPGAIAFFRYGMRNDEELVVSNYDATFAQPQPVPDPNSPRQLNPIEEALMLMAVGDSLTIMVPLDTVPAEQRPQGFENSNTLYYDLTLEDLKQPQELEASQAEVGEMINETIAAYEAGTLEGIQTTDSGLKYVIHEEGEGVVPDSADYVYVDYYGALLDGSRFDDSFSRGMPFAFQVGIGQVIPGWDEGLTTIPVGSRATFFIPAELGYGEAGAPPSIPGNSELVFYVELNDAQKPQ